MHCGLLRGHPSCQTVPPTDFQPLPPSGPPDPHPPGDALRWASRAPRVRPSGRTRLRLPGHWLGWALGGGALLGLVLFGGALDAGETMVIRKLEEKLAGRLGADVRVGRVRPALVGAELRDVVIRGPGGVRIDADEVRVPLDLANVASERGTPFAEVRLRGVDIVVDPHSDETRAWMRELGGGAGAGRDREVHGGDELGRGGVGGAGPGGDVGAPESGAADSGDGKPRRDLGSGLDLSTVDLEISDLAVRFIDARGESRALFSGGSFRIDRSAGRRTQVAGGAALAGRGWVSIEGLDGPDGSELAIRVTDPAIRWILPFLPAGVVLEDIESTRLAGRVDLTRASPDGLWSGDGSFEVLGVTLVSEKLAEGPVTFPRLVLTAGEIEVAADRGFTLDDATLTVGSGVSVQLEARVALRPEGLGIRVHGSIPETPCQELVEVFPASLLHDLGRLQLDGAWSARALLDLDMADLQATELALGFDDGCRFRGMPERFQARALRGAFRHQVPATDDRRAVELITGPGSSHWVPLEQISPYVVQAVLAHEDATFYEHGGFAPVAIRNSLVENLEAGSFERGASTITMQLAKNLYLSRRKVMARKLREVFITWWLEHALTKREILALYLNVIEYGPNLYGIGPASRHYFDAPPSSLGPAEAVFLATVLPAPKLYHHNYVRGALSASTESQMRFLLGHMHRKGRIDEDSVEWGLEALESFRFGRVQPSPPSPWWSWEGFGDLAEISGSADRRTGPQAGSPPG